MREEGFVAQGFQRDIAEDAHAAVLAGQTAHDLGATEQQQVVDGGQQAFAFSDRQVVGGHQHRALGIAQPREALVKLDAPLRQADDGLEIEVDAVLAERFLDCLGQAVAVGVRGFGGTVARRGQALVDRFAHLLDQAFQHPDLAGQGVGLGKGAVLDGLGHFRQGPLGGLHGIGQQTVRLTQLADFHAQGAAVHGSRHQGMKGNQDAAGTQGSRDARACAHAGAPDHRPHGEGEEDVAKDQKSAGNFAHRTGVVSPFPYGIGRVSG